MAVLCSPVQGGNHSIQKNEKGILVGGWHAAVVTVMRVVSLMLSIEVVKSDRNLSTNNHAPLASIF